MSDASEMPEISQIAGADPARCILVKFRFAIARQLSCSLGISTLTCYEGVDIGRKEVDFTVAIPRFRLKAKPQELAMKVVNEFVQDEYVEEIRADGVFLHYTMNKKTLNRLVLGQVYALSQPTPNRPYGTYGTNLNLSSQKIIVEFSSPNIAKPFHAGHLRSTVIGTFVSNIYEACGAHVIRMNYLGDWGKQFGLLAVGFERYGSEKQLAENAIMHLFDVYVRVNKDIQAEGNPSATNENAKEVFRLMEAGDPSTIALWKRFRDLSIKSYEAVYRRLNVHFDVYAGESLVKPEEIREVIGMLHEKGMLVEKKLEESLAKKDYKKGGKYSSEKKAENNPTSKVEDAGAPRAVEGPLALAVDLNEWKLGKPVVQKPDGTTIYMVRDIAGAFQRYTQYAFDKMIYVVGDQQDLHVAQFFKILALIDFPAAGKLAHISFGRVNGMSTRAGEVKFLDEILDAAREVMLEQMGRNEEKVKHLEDPVRTADEVGITCVKIQDMAAKRIISYDFDWKRMTSFEGDTGAYLQYQHARLCSVARKLAPSFVLRSDPAQIDTSLLTERAVHDIVTLLARYPDVVLTAAGNCEPSTLVTYCFRLARVVSSGWETLIIKDQEEELAQARLLLFTCAKNVLASAMALLSLVPLERM